MIKIYLRTIDFEKYLEPIGRALEELFSIDASLRDLGFEIIPSRYFFVSSPDLSAHEESMLFNFIKEILDK